MPLHLPKRSNYGHVLLEIEKPELSFDADTGDIGRIKTSQSKLTVDIQGKIYEGPLVETPTIMLASIDGKVAQCEAVIQNVCRMQHIHSMYDFEAKSGELKPLIIEHNIEVDKSSSEKVAYGGKGKKGAVKGKGSPVKVSSGKGKRRS